jgi:hypothetical protein
MYRFFSYIVLMLLLRVPYTQVLQAAFTNEDGEDDKEWAFTHQTTNTVLQDQLEQHHCGLLSYLRPTSKYDIILQTIKHIIVKDSLLAARCVRLNKYLVFEVCKYI